MNISTLFSGLGSPEVAAQRVYGKDTKTIFAAEWDEDARLSYQAIHKIQLKHFYKDVCDLDATKYKDQVDILIGGSPCQSYSIIGNREGTNDHRGQLIYEYIRVVEECKPKVIIYENVKGILSIDDGKTINEFKKKLHQLGYSIKGQLLNTKNYNVPQNRERYYLVGFLDHSVARKFSFAPKQKLQTRIKDILEDHSKVDKSYFFPETRKDSLRSAVLNGESVILKSFRKEPAKGFKFQIPYYPPPKVGVVIPRREQLTLRVSNKKDILGDIQGFREDTGMTIGDIQYQRTSSVSKCICAVPLARIIDFKTEDDGDDFVLRKMTPRECLRLQDFPERDIDILYTKQKSTPLLKQAGNSMTVKVVELLMNQIEKAKETCYYKKENTNEMEEW